MKQPFARIAIPCLGCLWICLLPAPSEAGLFDWLFKRDRTAARPLDAATTRTAGYAPQGSCGAGFCQQTVVRYVPQIAYRTAYQPVPVTTYKTSTSINPANGLPMTCTRPCTTYSYQARRVPYTTYRPVYTTVPVGDPLAAATTGSVPASQPPSLLPMQPTRSLYPPLTYGYAPSSCNNYGDSAAVADPGAYYSRPGYTPGNGALEPADQPPSLQRSLRPDYYSDFRENDRRPSGATQWRPVTPSRSTNRLDPADGYAYDSNSYSGRDRYRPGATDWSPLPRDGRTAPPSSRDYDNYSSPADRAPDLREQGSSGIRSRRPPLPRSLQSTNDTLDLGSDDDFGPITDEDADRKFATPGSDPLTNQPRGNRPRVQRAPDLGAPANQDSRSQTKRWRRFDSAVPDFERAPQDRRWWNRDDKTARTPRPMSTRMSRSPQTPQPSTRYAAVPIHWGDRPSRGIPVRG